MTIYGERSKVCLADRNHYSPLLSIGRWAWFGHVMQYNSLCKTIIQVTVEEDSSVEGNARTDQITSKSAMPELLKVIDKYSSWRRLPVYSALRSPRTRRLKLSRD